MKNIAIVYVSSGYDFSDLDVIARSISEWQEVSDEDYKYIIAAQSAQYIVICREDFEQEKISIQNMIDTGKRILEDRAKKQRKYEEQRKRIKEKRNATLAQNKLKKLQKLTQELKEAKLI